MTKHYLTHDEMVIEREYAATSERVFAAFADEDAKRVWMVGAEDELSGVEYELDFRVGGGERIVGEVGGHVWTYQARYEDIVDGERLVYTYYMLRDDTRISVSATSVEFTANDDNTTKLTLTEHGIYLDGEDKPELRFEGLSAQLDALGPWLARSAGA